MSYLNQSGIEIEGSEEKKSSQMSLTQKVFSKLLADPENLNCFDCGNQNPAYVSINLGIFLCFNCGVCIHRLHYGIEISYIKSVHADTWNHQQLRVLINSGNKLLREFLEFYDLLYEPLKAKIYGQQFTKEKPSYEIGHRDIMQELFEWEELSLIETNSSLYSRFVMYISDLEKHNEQIFLQNGNVPLKDQMPLNPNLPPRPMIASEPFCDNNGISNEDYLLLINRLNEFADNTFTFGESIFKKIEEVGNINETLKNTADKIVNKSSEISTSFIKKTRESITSINQSQKITSLREKATDKLTSLGGKLWGFFGSSSDSKQNSDKKQKEETKGDPRFDTNILSIQNESSLQGKFKDQKKISLRDNLIQIEEDEGNYDLQQNYDQSIDKIQSSQF
ncbi:arf gtpase activator [Stylonychia lemnae]|uniref:Arf gtpase activator n=1 Tax=Stylonychia lemnae TaxID=5949 RepID=A0A078B2V6_STYLE|nr:arf gtpase activator [Stylonychia lemnae]|eukprot:CDW88860.1 arf gtpase activator [Stylonychia lemnae]